MTLARGAKTSSTHARSNTAIAVVGIDIGKNSFHVDRFSRRRQLLNPFGGRNRYHLQTVKLLLKGKVVVVSLFPSVTNVTARSVPVQT
jgi:hypothetical protein